VRKRVLLVVLGVSLAAIALGIYVLAVWRRGDGSAQAGRATDEPTATMSGLKTQDIGAGSGGAGGTQDEPEVRAERDARALASGKSAGGKLDAEWLSEQVDKWNPAWSERVPIEFLEDPANAFNRYLLAAALMVPDDSNPHYGAVKEILWSKNLDWINDPQKVGLVEAYLDVNAEALGLLKAAIAEAEYYQSPPVVGDDAPLAYLAKFRALARLLAWEAGVLEAKGEMDGSLENCLAAIKMGNGVKSATCVIENLVGVAIAAIGGSSLESVLSDARDPELCLEATRRLGELRSSGVNCSGILRHELEVIAEIYSDPDVLREIASGLGADGRQRYQGLGELSEEELRERMQQLPALLGPLAEAAALPYPEFAALPGANVDEDSAFGRFVEQQWDLYKGLVATLYRKEAMIAAYEVLAGVKLYQLQSGAFPESLDQLVPACLSEMPKDPFSGEPFKYLRTGEGAIVYSVGPDMKDDLAEKITTGGMREGDIVFQLEAGIIDQVIPSQPRVGDFATVLRLVILNCFREIAISGPDPRKRARTACS